MGCTFNGKVLTNIIPLFAMLIFVNACGEFLGFSSLPEPDLGDITRIEVHLSPESLQKLYNSVAVDDFAPCIYEENGSRIRAFIKVRGFTSRLYPKKSFTVKIETDNNTRRYCLESFCIQNRIAFFAYKKAGLCVPDTEGVALSINGEYIGCYTKIEIYNEADLNKHYNTHSGQLFKCHFRTMGEDVPLHFRSEKQFPDNDDFSLLDNLIHNVAHMKDMEWEDWMKKNIDEDDIIRYMIVHDFLAVRDTSIQNFYIYAHKKMLILPWDNGVSMNPEKLPAIGGHNLLTKRLLEDPSMKTRYNTQMETYFLQAGEQNIVGSLQSELDRIYDEIDRAVYYDPTYYIDYEEFLDKKERLHSFIANRHDTIPAPPLP
jgi:hypothetical protein